MKTGKVAKALGVDPKTIRDWSDREEFAPFLSDSARGLGSVQRGYTDLDLVVMNTINTARSINTEWEDIAKSLEEGYRDTQLPPSALLVSDSAPIQQLAEKVYIQAQYEIALKEIELLKEQLSDQSSLHREDIKRYQERIEQLSQEVGKWKAYYEIESSKKE